MRTRFHRLSDKRSGTWIIASVLSIGSIVSLACESVEEERVGLAQSAFQTYENPSAATPIGIIKNHWSTNPSADGFWNVTYCYNSLSAITEAQKQWLHQWVVQNFNEQTGINLQLLPGSCPTTDDTTMIRVSAFLDPNLCNQDVACWNTCGDAWAAPGYRGRGEVKAGCPSNTITQVKLKCTDDWCLGAFVHELAHVFEYSHEEEAGGFRLTPHDDQSIMHGGDRFSTYDRLGFELLYPRPNLPHLNGDYCFINAGTSYCRTDSSVWNDWARRGATVASTSTSVDGALRSLSWTVNGLAYKHPTVTIRSSAKPEGATGVHVFKDPRNRTITENVVYSNAKHTAILMNAI